MCGCVCVDREGMDQIFYDNNQQLCPPYSIWQWVVYLLEYTNTVKCIQWFKLWTLDLDKCRFKSQSCPLSSLSCNFHPVKWARKGEFSEGMSVKG